MDDFSARRLITALTSSAQDAPESASDQEHRGHRLQPQGRILVQSLSKLLRRSELQCWDLLQPIYEENPGAPAMLLETLAVKAHLDPRSELLRDLLKVLKGAGAQFDDASYRDRIKALEHAAAKAKSEDGSSAGCHSLNNCLFDELHFLLRACRDDKLTATEEKCGNAAVVENRRRNEVRLICLCIFYRCLCDDSDVRVRVASFFHRPSWATLTKSDESKRGAAAALWQSSALHGPPECSHVLFLAMLVALIRENEPAASKSVGEWTAAEAAMAADPRLKALFDKSVEEERLVEGRLQSSVQYVNLPATTLADACSFFEACRHDSNCRPSAVTLTVIPQLAGSPN